MPCRVGRSRTIRANAERATETAAILPRRRNAVNARAAMRTPLRMPLDRSGGPYASGSL